MSDDRRGLTDDFIEWRGYVSRALDDIDKQIARESSLRKEFEENRSKRDDVLELRLTTIDTKIDDLKSLILNQRVKLAGISATVAILVSLVLRYVL